MFALQHALSAAAGGGCVDSKEYEKKRDIMQQCKEKIESVCFDIRLRKVLAARARAACRFGFLKLHAHACSSPTNPPPSPPQAEFPHVDVSAYSIGQGGGGGREED